MVIGAAGELPKPPSTPVVFLEGMSRLCPILQVPNPRFMPCSDRAYNCLSLHFGETLKLAARLMVTLNAMLTSLTADMDDSELAKAVSTNQLHANGGGAFVMRASHRGVQAL